MPTISGVRRRGYSLQAGRSFISNIGYTKYEALNDVSLLESAAREDLKPKAMRVCAIMDPIKLILTNYEEGAKEELQVENNPENPDAGVRTIQFSRELYIERGDFMEDAPKDFFRLSPNGREVRLKSAYIIQATGCKKDEHGNVIEVYAQYDPTTKSGTEGGNRKVKSTINWVEVENSVPAEVRLYDRLFNVEDPAAYEGDFHDLINPDSLTIINTCRVEPWLAQAKPLDQFQFLKIGYFNVDSDSKPGKLVFNRTVSLKDTWAKKNK